MSILNAPDLKRERVPVPEWGEGAEVILQEMSALDRDRLRSELYSVEGDPVNVAAKVLVRCIVDETGARVFCDEESEALGRKSTAVIQRLFAITRSLNEVLQTAEESEEGIKK